MCKALEDIKKYELEKGVREGIKQGREEGRKQGVRQGRKQGEKLGAIKMLCSLVSDGLLKPEEAARRVNLSLRAFGMEMKKAGYRQGAEVPVGNCGEKQGISAAEGQTEGNQTEEQTNRQRGRWENR